MLAALAVGVFVVGLQLQLPIWPAAIGDGAVEIFSHLALGFGVALTPVNLLYARSAHYWGLIGARLYWPCRDDRDAAADDAALQPVSAPIMLAASTTARSTAARRRRSSSTCLANRRRLSPASTDTRWRARAGRRGARHALGSFFAGTCATILVAAGRCRRRRSHSSSGRRVLR